MGRIARILGILFVIALLAVGGVLAWGYGRFVVDGPAATDRTVVVPRGAGVARIADLLYRHGILKDPMVFRAGVRLLGAAQELKAGEFLFPARVSARGALEVLRRGETVVRRVTVAEGLSTVQVLELLNRVEGLEGSLPLGLAEGTLLPETYHFSYGDTRADLVRRMQDGLRETLAELWPGRAAGLPLASPSEAVVLASIVERETGRTSERARVAGVFINRLRRGMRLQSDPTVAYGLSPGRPLGRGLTRTDLKSPTDYNTYMIKGLPPGPICNPGRAALAAVLNPARTQDLYFVADGTGGHLFARTLTEHNRNVARWRKIEKERKSR